MKHKGERVSECINTTERVLLGDLSRYLCLIHFPINSYWWYFFHRMLLGNISQFTNNLIKQSEKNQDMRFLGHFNSYLHYCCKKMHADKNDPDRISTLTSREDDNWEVTLIWLCNLKTKWWMDKHTHTHKNSGRGWKDRNRRRKIKYTEGIALTNYRMVYACVCMCLLCARWKANKCGQ